MKGGKEQDIDVSDFFYFCTVMDCVLLLLF